MGGEDRAQRVAAFGRWLRQERELRGLARDEVARQTKIAPALIEALESGDAERMPPRAYLVGYLRGYAAAIGLDPDDLVLRWQEAEGAGEAGPPRPGAGPPGRGRRLVLGLALAGLLLAALLGTWLRCERTRDLSLPGRPPRALDRAPYGR